MVHSSHHDSSIVFIGFLAVTVTMEDYMHTPNYYDISRIIGTDYNFISEI